jgi:hypothetical protein
VKMLRGSEGTLQICVDLNCYNTVKHNNVFYSVMTTCFGLTRPSLYFLCKNFNNIVQYSAKCACYVELI